MMLRCWVTLGAWEEIRLRDGRRSLGVSNDANLPRESYPLDVRFGRAEVVVEWKTRSSQQPRQRGREACSVELARSRCGTWSAARNHGFRARTAHRRRIDDRSVLSVKSRRRFDRGSRRTRKSRASSDRKV